MIESVAWRIAVHIKTNVPEHPASVERLNHSLIIIINFFTVVGLTLLISIFTGNTIEAVLLLKSFAILRQLTGGLHLESSITCAIVTALSATGLSFVHLNINWIIIFTILSMIVILLYAPSGIEDQTIIPKRFYPYLKLGALLLVGLNLWMPASTAAIAYLVQSMTVFVNQHRGEVKS